MSVTFLLAALDGVPGAVIVMVGANVAFPSDLSCTGLVGMVARIAAVTLALVVAILEFPANIAALSASGRL